MLSYTCAVAYVNGLHEWRRVVQLCFLVEGENARKRKDNYIKRKKEGEGGRVEVTKKEVHRGEKSERKRAKVVFVSSSNVEV